MNIPQYIAQCCGNRKPRLFSQRCFALLLCQMIVAPSFAVEIYRLRADIDGDGKAETIQVLTYPAVEEWRSKVIVKVGESRYTTEFFSGGSDLPDIQLMSVYSNRKQRQLLLEAPEPGSCIYHLLTYSDHQLVPLMRFDSGPDCKAPRALGGGYVSVSTWRGFWSKEDRYSLSADGKALNRVEEDSYFVGVAGAAARRFSLGGAECTARWVEPGTYVKVKLYEPDRDRYRVETIGGGCGWIPSAIVSAMDSPIQELPWAG